MLSLLFCGCSLCWFCLPSKPPKHKTVLLFWSHRLSLYPPPPPNTHTHAPSLGCQILVKRWPRLRLLPSVISSLVWADENWQPPARTWSPVLGTPPPWVLSLALWVVATKFRVERDMFLARDGGGLPAFYGLSLQPQPLSPSPMAFLAEL